MENKKAKIVVVGGGFGGLFTALELPDTADITLINEDDQFVFTPMLYEYLSGEVEAWHIAPYIKDLLDGRVRFVRGLVETVDFNTQTVNVAGRRIVPYDVLVLAAGGVSNFYNIPGAAQYAVPFRKVQHADELRRRMISALDHVAPSVAPQDARAQVTFAVVGAGASGVELATKMADLLYDAFSRRNLPGEPRVLVVEMSDQIVPGMGDELREHVSDALRQSRVEVHLQARVVEVKPHSIVIEHDGEQTEIPTAAVVWTAGVKPSPLIEKLDLEKDERGLILVEPTLQARNRANVLVLGDIAKVTGIEVPKPLGGTAQLAFQESSLAAENVRALLAGRPLRTREFEELGEALSLGTENAAVLVGDKAFGGTLARQARFALYTSRLPTWHHRLKVGASWFLGGTEAQPLQPLGFNN